MTKHLVPRLSIAIILCCLINPNAIAQETRSQHPRPIEIRDVKDWQRITGFTLSPDGAWCAFVQQPNEGDVSIIIKQLEGDKRYDVTSGPSSGQIAFSHDSQWVCYLKAPLDKEAKAARKAKKPVKNQAVLLELDSGSETVFDNARRLSFSGEQARWLAVHQSSSDLILHDLNSKARINLGNVDEFQFNKLGDWLAATIKAEDEGSNGLLLFNTEDARMVPLDNAKALYQRLSWTEEGDALTVLKAVEDKDFENRRVEVLAFRELTKTPPTRVHVKPDDDPGIPEDMTVSTNRSASWTESRDAVLFGIHELKKKKSDKPTRSVGEEDPKPDSDESTSSGDEEDAELVIWHWQDKRMQSQQQVQESRDKNFSFLCIHRIAEAKTMRLGTDEMPDVSAPKPHLFATGVDNANYERMGNLDGRRYQDVYVIDLKTGKRRLALEKARWFMGVSPSGTRLLYYQDGHFYVMEMDTGESRNISENVPVSFINTEDDHNVVDPPIRPIGWSSDSNSVVLYDNWDMWRVPVESGTATNLTVNGKAEGIRYARRFSLDPDEEGIDFSQPVYVSAYGERTKKNGIGRILAGQTGVELLLWDDASFGGIRKLKDRDVYQYTRETPQQSPNWYVGGPDLKDAKQTTDSNPQQKNFRWSAGARIVNYQSSRGEDLQAALYLPADYIEGKKYPTIVYIYEKLSQRLNSYDSPRVGGFSAAVFTSQGYAVLSPDIVYEVNQPGMSAVACVLPAVDAAVATGVVDADRVGLHGHSWGGYQTAFLVTQTDKFKAAIAGAPLTNMISMYSSIYWNTGGANMAIFESSQGRFIGGYWEALEEYAQNSPVYFAENVQTPLVILHNDEDGAVDWNQGIEYFNTLRRLNKPVVMLQYTGENHGLRKLPNRKDYSDRMLQFFDHYLKDKPAPIWWSEGVKHLDLQEHIETMRKKREGQ